MCSRTEATLRLIAAWLDRAVDDPDFPYRVTLADMLTEDNIAIVSEMDLLTEYSGEERQKKAAALDAETIRNQAMLRAWACTKPEGCGVAVTVADLMQWMLLLIAAIALVAWVTTHPFRRVRDAPRQMINTFAESAKN
jgi:hypothetical protein